MWGVLQEVAVLNRNLNFVIWLLYVGRFEESSKKRLLWLCTKAAMMLDWGSSTLDITTAGIVGISYCCMVLCIAMCWRWQCLLTVDGNLLPHIVTPLDVTTVAWCCRQTQEVLHPAECQQQHCKHHSDSGQQVSSLPDIALEVITVRVLKIVVFNIICHYGSFCWIGVIDKCFTWFSPLRYISLNSCQFVLHLTVWFFMNVVSLLQFLNFFFTA